MLQAIELTKGYGKQTALQPLNLEVKRGEIFYLLGANGAGKTTTISLFLNFIEPSGGQAFINGLDVVAHPLETKKHISHIPEQVSLYRNLTGFENLDYFATLANGAAVDLLAGRFDLAFVLVYLFPLLVLALGYNMISAEREQGTLSLALSQPITMSQLVTGVDLSLPAILAQSAINDLAGTSLGRYKHFSKRVDGFFGVWQTYFLPKVFSKAKLSSKEVGAFPVYGYKKETDGEILERVGVVLGGMLGLSGLVLAVAYGRLRKVSVAA